MGGLGDTNYHQLPHNRTFEPLSSLFTTPSFREGWTAPPSRGHSYIAGYLNFIISKGYGDPILKQLCSNYIGGLLSNNSLNSSLPKVGPGPGLLLVLPAGSATDSPVTVSENKVRSWSRDQDSQVM